jgi:NitT/TauT family transport system substrate-binding protein
MSTLTRGRLLAASAASAAALALPRAARSADLKEIIIAEPAHLFPYIPVYLAMNQGIFAKHGLDVKLLVALGGAHVSALVSGQVWGNLGGPESDAMTNNGMIADPLFAIVNFVNRALVYFCAKKGTKPASASTADMKAFFKGKKLALSRYGGTPDVLARQYLQTLGLDLKSDVTIINNGAIVDAPTLVKAGAADIAITTEPQVSFGVIEGIWEEPCYAFPSMGDYSFSCVSTKKSTITKDPATVQAFVTAMVEALHIVQTNRAVVDDAIKKDFPNIAPNVAKMALDRCYKDNLFSKDGIITNAAYEKDMKAVYDSGEMTRRVPLNDTVDMTFVNNALKKK